MTQSSLSFQLSRLDTGTLGNLLGQDTVDLLASLDLIRLTNSSLAELVLGKVGATELLQNPKHRALIVRNMNRTDATALVEALGIPLADNPWQTLLDTPLPKGSEKLGRLFSFFGYAFDCESGQNNETPILQIDPQYPLFIHQKRALAEAMQILTTAQVPRVLLHMPTGSGKTRTAMNIISNFLRSSAEDNGVVVWLAHSEELCDQAAEEFEKAWSILGDRPVEIYRHFANSRVADLEAVTNGVLIAGLKLLYEHSLRNQSEFLQLASRTKLIVMDEAHQAVAPTYKHLLNLLSPTGKTPLLGLSATPGRSFLNAGADLELANFFDHNKVALRVDGYPNPMLYLQEDGYLAKVVTINLPYNPRHPLNLTPNEVRTLQAGFDIPSTVLKRLEEDQVRNLLILSHILNEIKRGSKILVFACSVPHAALLADVLKIKGAKAACVTSQTSPKDREARISAFRDTDEIQVLTNYGVLTTGFDAPRTNCAFICRPTQSVVLYSQMVGRAARGTLAGGNTECRIFTVLDNLPGVKDISEAFTFWEDIWT